MRLYRRIVFLGIPDIITAMITLNDDNFKKELSAAEKPVVVDFWAEWCLPCNALGEILDSLMKEYEDSFIYAKVNIGEAPKTAQQFGIDRIPCIILFSKGIPINGFVGARPEPVLREWLESNRKISGKLSGAISNMVKEYEQFAKENNFKLNPDGKAVERLMMGLLENEGKHGARYCPCRRVTGNKEEDKAKICPCIYMREEIKKDGRCLCGLFFRG